MLYETKNFSIMDTILAIQKTCQDLAKTKFLIKEKVDPKVMEMINNDAQKRGTKAHFFNKVYKVRV